MSLVKEVKYEDVITYGDWIDRYHLLLGVQGLTGEKILYARVRNLMKLRTFATANSAERRIPETEGFREFKRELSELQKKYMIKAPNGNFVPDLGNADYVSAFNALLEKHRKAFDERQLDERAFKDFMNEPVPKEEIPGIHMVIDADNTEPLTQAQYDAIWWFLAESDQAKGGKLKSI